MFTRILCCLFLIGFVAQTPAAETATPSASPHASGTPMEFDSFLLVLLLRPPNAPEMPKAELDQLQQGHFANMKRLAAEGKLFKAGPIEDFSGRNVRGIFIFKTESVDQAREWVAGDPLIKAGRLVPEFMKWSVEKGSLK
ncbi:MAG: YciI family protein [Chthoniobacterales bacterium]